MIVQLFDVFGKVNAKEHNIVRLSMSLDEINKISIFCHKTKTPKINVLIIF